ncbi:hypothetical protein ES703_118646 [subsurface metagenome]
MDGISGLNLISTGLKTVAMLAIVLGLLILLLYFMKRFLFVSRGVKGDLLIKILSSVELVTRFLSQINTGKRQWD